MTDTDVRHTLAQLIIQSRVDMSKAVAAKQLLPKEPPFDLVMKEYELSGWKGEVAHRQLPVTICISLQLGDKNVVVEEWNISRDDPNFNQEAGNDSDEHDSELEQFVNDPKKNLILLTRYVACLTRLLPAYSLYKKKANTHYEILKTSKYSIRGQNLAVKKGPRVKVKDSDTTKISVYVDYITSVDQLLSQTPLTAQIHSDYIRTSSAAIPINIPSRNPMSISGAFSAPSQKQHEGPAISPNQVPRSGPIGIPKNQQQPQVPSAATGSRANSVDTLYGGIGSTGNMRISGGNSKSTNNPLADDDQDEFHIRTPASSSFQGNSSRDGHRRLSFSPFREPSTSTLAKSSSPPSAVFGFPSPNSPSGMFYGESATSINVTDNPVNKSATESGGDSGVFSTSFQMFYNSPPQSLITGFKVDDS